MKALRWCLASLLLASVGLTSLPGLSLGQLTPETPGKNLFTGLSPNITENKIFQRWLWAFEQRAYPLGYIPDGAHLRAFSQNLAAPASLQDGAQKWQSIGPAPMNGGQIGAKAVSRKMSGRVTAIAVDPGDLNHWLIGGAQGGVWETENAGKSWKPKTDAQASLAMGAIAFAPNDTQIVYAGTGEAHFSADSYGGAGLLKSIDGGTNWELLAANYFKHNAFSAIRVHPTNPKVLVAATTTAVAGRGGTSPLIHHPRVS